MKLTPKECDVLDALLQILWAEGPRGLPYVTVRVKMKDKRRTLAKLEQHGLLAKECFSQTHVYVLSPEALLLTPRGQTVLNELSRLIRFLAAQYEEAALAKEEQAKVDRESIKRALRVDDTHLEVTLKFFCHWFWSPLRLSSGSGADKDGLIDYVSLQEGIIDVPQDAGEAIRFCQAKRKEAAEASRKPIVIGGPELAGVFEGETADDSDAATPAAGAAFANKPAGNAKGAKKVKAIALAATNPDWTYAKIAKEAGCSEGYLNKKHMSNAIKATRERAAELDLRNRTTDGVGARDDLLGGAETSGSGRVVNPRRKVRQG